MSDSRGDRYGVDEPPACEDCGEHHEGYGDCTAPGRPVRFFPDLRDVESDSDRRFFCTGCMTVWAEDDLQQVQPDGHYACPFEQCGDDTIVAHSGPLPDELGR